MTISSAQTIDESLKRLQSPFTDPDRTARFLEVVAQYRMRDPALFLGLAQENRSTKAGDAFWRGWHSERCVWGRDSKLWIPFRAGRLIRKALSPKKPPMPSPVRSWQRRAVSGCAVRSQA